jgi:hypothetical protein
MPANTGQRAKGYFNPCPQRACDLASRRPQKDCRSPKSALGKVAEGAQDGITGAEKLAKPEDVAGNKERLRL